MSAHPVRVRIRATVPVTREAETRLAEALGSGLGLHAALGTRLGKVSLDSVRAL